MCNRSTSFTVACSIRRLHHTLILWIHVAVLCFCLSVSLTTCYCYRCHDKCGAVRTILQKLHTPCYYTVARIVKLFVSFLSLDNFLMVTFSYRGNMQTTQSTFHLKDMVSVPYCASSPLFIMEIL